MESLAKQADKIQVGVSKAREEEEKFAKATEERLRKRLEEKKENREAQIKALQERLREHVSSHKLFQTGFGVKFLVLFATPVSSEEKTSNRTKTICSEW